ncbi:hypothetical protein SAMN00017405_0755 [Desulfonispora thiosulfatigenes DSM 11270]|uniref:Nitroimidazol reductase NimA, pyridoxamine 5'-phosphate oxidase superfamily n=1 Tax=Desulfonispora thiosulfatigenes DSM 11270 TaxID=656914 RepID=A0A1W1UE71_DESTI|nr:pyridoxamine 5'-phosphate oxidase family protein [Desulfonispora thiosulfatigenes]SMB79405.1 hypothetical protein SAMN00017405_0755 [Desulfonispora thiosulfatigenes DSM 11270]
MTEMRRKDREMNTKFAQNVIDGANFATLSMIDNVGLPYGIPISFVRDGDIIYFHSALEGKKVDILKKNPLVSMSFVGKVEVPQLFTQDEIKSLIAENKFSLLARKVYTTEFESTIVSGKTSLLVNKEEKIKALRLICQKYTPNYMDYFSYAIESSLNHTLVYRLDIEKISGKRKRFDEHGEEMKWGRM